jgi:hypothetical protein
MSLRKLLTTVSLVLIPAAAIVLLLVAAPVPRNMARQTPDLGSLSDADLKAVLVHMVRTECFGSCAAYTITIHGDGRVEYEGKSNVKTKGKQEGRIEPAAVKALMAEFAKAKYLALPEEYSEGKCSCRRCTDMPTAVTELNAPGAKHRVSHYYGCACAPKELFALESAIDKAANSEQWTGDVSKQGPFGTTCFG